MYRLNTKIRLTMLCLSGFYVGCPFRCCSLEIFKKINKRILNLLKTSFLQASIKKSLLLLAFNPWIWVTSYFDLFFLDTIERPKGDLIYVTKEK